MVRFSERMAVLPVLAPQSVAASTDTTTEYLDASGASQVAFLVSAAPLGEGKSRSPYGRKYFLRCGMCAAAFLVCVVLEYVAVSPLVAGVAGALSG